MNRPLWLRLFLHRRGWIASPSLAWMDVPFGPDKRNLAVEVMTSIADATANDPCPLCGPDEACPFDRSPVRP